VGLLVGGLIFSAVGSSLSSKADDAWNQMLKAEKEIEKICSYMKELSSYSQKYQKILSIIQGVYNNHIEKLSQIIEHEGKHDWNIFTNEERKITENTVMLVQLLFQMCKVKIVLQSENSQEMNRVNTQEVDQMMVKSENILSSQFFLERSSREEF
jgi:hypothetical protein